MLESKNNIVYFRKFMQGEDDPILEPNPVEEDYEKDELREIKKNLKK